MCLCEIINFQIELLRQIDNMIEEIEITDIIIKIGETGKVKIEKTGMNLSCRIVTIG